MGFLDRLLGRPEQDRYDRAQNAPSWGTPQAPQQLTDEQAIERYRYLLRTAPPEKIEEAHREAFATLTPEQRAAVLQELSRDLPPEERPASDDPRHLARAATRAEMRSPGTLERSFGRSGGYGMGMGGMGMGGALAGGLLAGVAGAFIGTAVADAMFDLGPGDGGLFETGDGEAAEAAEYGDTGDGGGYDGGYDGGGFDGGDFGGGDF